MKKIKDIEFGETCCGEHSFVAEYVRDDGVGFLIKRSPDTGLYSASIYAPDKFTLIQSEAEKTEDQMDEMLEKSY